MKYTSNTIHDFLKTGLYKKICEEENVSYNSFKKIVEHFKSGTKNKMLDCIEIYFFDCIITFYMTHNSYHYHLVKHVAIII